MAGMTAEEKKEAWIKRQLDKAPPPHLGALGCRERRPWHQGETPGAGLTQRL